jgi:hypothetical protein
MGFLVGDGALVVAEENDFAQVTENPCRAK